MIISMLILIDADPIVYRCGFAAETTSWHIIYETNTAEAGEIEFHADDMGSAGEYMRHWLEANEGRITVLDKSRVVKPDPVSFALRATKVQIESIISECEAKFGPCKMLMWISAGKCYRDKIATVRPYKGNRDPTHKPYHYAAIRDYLRTQYSAFVATGIEADDAVSIYARNLLATGGSSYVVATIDKDLDQIPGNHYNYMNKVHYAITQTEAERWFVYQCLAGDITDNIVGVWKCGPTAAVKLLNTIPESAFHHASVRTDNGHVLLHKRARGYAGSDGVYDSNPNSKELRGTGAKPAGVDSTDRGSVGAGSAESQLEPAYMAGESSADRQSGEPGSERSDREILRSGCGGATYIAGERSSEHLGQPITGGTGESVCRSTDERNLEAGVFSGDAEQCTGKPYIRSPAWWPTVLAAYVASQRKLGCPYAEDSAEAVAIEMAQLVKLQEYPGQLWHPHGDLVVPGFGEENFDG